MRSHCTFPLNLHHRSPRANTPSAPTASPTITAEGGGTRTSKVREVGDESGDYEPVDPAIDAALGLGGDPEAIRQYYQDWATAYDQDVGSHRYSLPDEVAGLLAQVAALDRGEPIDGLTIDPAPPDPAIIDVGCGTGLVGLRLAVAGYRTIDGLDLSPAMVAKAEERGCYRTLTSDVDITEPIPTELRGAYDIAVAGGLFTVGHVSPEALADVATLVRPGGLAIITTRLQYYEQTDYQQVSDRLEREGVLQLLHRNANAPYTLDSPGHYWAYLVRGPAGTSLG